MQFGKQNSWSTWWYSKPFLVLMVGLVVLLAVSVFERYQVERDMAARSAAAQAELDALMEREAELTERVEYLRGERGVEEEIRKNFDVARVGEQVVIISGEPPVLPSEPVTVPNDAPWYVFWR